MYSGTPARTYRERFRYARGFFLTRRYGQQVYVHGDGVDEVQLHAAPALRVIPKSAL
jgi:hypothetical protein